MCQRDSIAGPTHMKCPVINYQYKMNSTDFRQGPRNFYWLVPNEIAGSSCPSSNAEMQWLKRQGFYHIITLSDDFIPPEASLRHFQHVGIFIEEFEPPTLEQIKQFITICSKARVNTQPMMVHCRQGLGRTGVMLACYLVHYKEMHWRAAIARVRNLRPWSVETREQEMAVRDYHSVFTQQRKI